MRNSRRGTKEKKKNGKEGGEGAEEDKKKKGREATRGNEGTESIRAKDDDAHGEYDDNNDDGQGCGEEGTLHCEREARREEAAREGVVRC